MEEKNQTQTQKQSKSRSIKLYCPSVSKIAQIMAWEDQKLDLGTIARTFGLEPSSLKLNGHFISRGVDLVASSVTWRSLLSFFSSRGLSTGTDGSGALIVDGNLSKSGTKRSHAPAEVENGGGCVRISEKGIGVGRNPQQEDIKSPNSKKLRESSNGCENDSQRAKCSNSRLKRKNWLENISPFKRLRVNGSYSNDISQGNEERGTKKSCLSPLPCGPCGYLSKENIKRMREDEVLVAASCKRAR